ncbi:MAG: PQQ-binding-like beta-propeller repeat protein [Planctomyces sp.]|nr:PQQ-binding-like beta-propeller repeat protein [Planctomyces sp.]
MGCALGALGLTLNVTGSESSESREDPTALAVAEIAKREVQPGDWPMWGGWTQRNNTPEGKNIPTEWDVDSGENILWSVPLGSQTYGNQVVANGKVYIGTNNHHAWLARFPKTIDLGVLLCFDEKTGEFLWQHSSQKLPTGRVHDWPDQGICAAVYAEGDRVWFVSSRGEVICLDANGFRDGENNGPFKQEDNENQDEADVIWKYDMMGQMGVSQHNMCSCSLVCVGDTLFVCTANGVDETHINIPAPNAPSFFAMNRDTGAVLWTDKSPGVNILHGQWSSPTYAVLGGQAQVLFGGGDGYLYSFDPAGDGQGNSRLLWKFDCNPKTSLYSVSGRSTRNHIIATPVVYDGLVYVAVGEDPEHGEGNGHLWCIDPTKRGDVSPELAQDKDGNELPQRRLQAVDERVDEQAVPNPNSAVVWHYVGYDANGNGKLEFEEEMHRTCGTAVIKDDLLYIADFSGLVHCLDAKTGEQHWTYDMFAASWGSPLLVDGKVYIGDEDGDVAIFRHSKEMDLIAEVNMGNSVYSTPIVANNVLYIANKSRLYAIGEKSAD